MSGVIIAIVAPPIPQKKAHLYKIFGPPNKNQAKNISERSHI